MKGTCNRQNVLLPFGIDTIDLLLTGIKELLLLIFGKALIATIRNFIEDDINLFLSGFIKIGSRLLWLRFAIGNFHIRAWFKESFGL